MKGASPIPPKQPTEEATGQYLRHHLTDKGGVTASVMLRPITQSEALLGDYDQPLVALSKGIQRVLEWADSTTVETSSREEKIVACDAWQRYC